MRDSYVHCASLVTADGDNQAPGAAVTVALCGHWEHEPPCPLAPHHTSTQPRDGLLDVRVVFVAEPHDEAEVRARIVAALTAGQSQAASPTAVWTLASEAVGSLTAAETALAARLATSSGGGGAG